MWPREACPGTNGPSSRTRNQVPNSRWSVSARQTRDTGALSSTVFSMRSDMRNLQVANCIAASAAICNPFVAYRPATGARAGGGVASSPIPKDTEAWLSPCPGRIAKRCAAEPGPSQTGAFAAVAHRRRSASRKRDASLDETCRGKPEVSPVEAERDHRARRGVRRVGLRPRTPRQEPTDCAPAAATPSRWLGGGGGIRICASVRPPKSR